LHIRVDLLSERKICGPRKEFHSRLRKLFPEMRFLPAAARAESPAKPDFARISAAAARRQKVPLKNRGVRQSFRTSDETSRVLLTIWIFG
jgi:hypothetical protein